MSMFHTHTAPPGTVPGLTNGAKYRTRVRSRSAAGVSAWSAFSAVYTLFTNDAAGVSMDVVWGGLTNQQITDQVNKAKALGVRNARLNLSWNMLETAAKGTYNDTNIATYDHAINSLVNAGIKILATFGHSVPYWASADPNKSGGTSWNQKWRPTRFSDYADNCTYMMQRWGTKFEIVQIWNEPDNAGFWPSKGTQNDRIIEYRGMLEAGYNAVKTVNKAMPVAMGGLSGGNNYLGLHQLYQAGGRPFFDLAAWHPYTDNVDPALEFTETNRITGVGTVKAKDSFWGMDTCRQVMIDNGDEAKGAVLTEWGYSTTTTTGGVTEANQAAFLGRGWDRIVARPYVKRAYWYLLRETTFTSPPDPYGFDWLNEFGLTTNALANKPAATEFAAKSGGGPAVLFSETFTAANGTAFDTTRWADTTLRFTSTANVQNNQGSFVAQGGVFAHSRVRTVHAAAGNFELTGTMTTPTAGEQYWSIGFRCSTTAPFWRASDDEPDPRNGYVVKFDYNAGTIRLARFIDSGFLLLGGPVSVSLGTSARRFRVSAVGSALKVRTWLAAESEPTVWNIEATDTTYTSGVESVGHVNGSDGGAKTLLVDDLRVTAA